MNDMQEIKHGLWHDPSGLLYFGNISSTESFLLTKTPILYYILTNRKKGWWRSLP